MYSLIFLNKSIATPPMQENEMICLQNATLFFSIRQAYNKVLDKRSAHTRLQNVVASDLCRPLTGKLEQLEQLEQLELLGS